jgi:hypothetical protein
MSLAPYYYTRTRTLHHTHTHLLRLPRSSHLSPLTAGRETTCLSRSLCLSVPAPCETCSLSLSLFLLHHSPFFNISLHVPFHSPRPFCCDSCGERLFMNGTGPRDWRPNGQPIHDQLVPPCVWSSFCFSR